jgi:hypothetical protein
MTNLVPVIRRLAPAPQQTVTFLILLIAATKIFWIADREVIAVASDQLTYARAANAFYWAQPYNLDNYIRLPGMPVLLWAVKQTGIPWRLAIELLYLAACYVFSRGCAAWTPHRAAPVVAFAVTALWPATLPIFDQLLSEALAAVLVVAATGYWMQTLAPEASKGRTIIKYGLCLGLWIVTRDEMALVAATLFFHLAAAAVITRHVAPRHWPGFFRGYAGIALVGVVIPWLLVCSINWVCLGFFYTHDMRLPGYKAAYRALLSIRPAEPPPRHIPIVKSVREQAYRVSPTFANLRSVFEGPDAFGRSHTEMEYPGSGGEIATGWMYWTLRHPRPLGSSYNARQANAHFKRIADEIRAAAARGEIQTRRVVHPFLDPNYGVWIGYLPASISAVANVFLGLDLPREWGETQDLVARQEFDEIANRRRSLIAQPPGRRLSLSGWVVPQQGKPSWVLLRDPSRLVVGSFGPLQPRPDVAAHFVGMGKDPGDRLGFSFGEIQVGSGGPVTLQLETLIDGLPPVSADLLVGGDGVARLQPTTADAASYGIDAFRLDESVPDAPFTRSRTPTAALSLLAALAAVGGVVHGIIKRRALPIWNVILLAAFAIAAARVGFYGLLDASSWNGRQPRYLFPGQAAFFGSVAAAVIAAVGDVIFRVRAPSRSDSH